MFSFSANSVRENRIVEEYDREPTIWQGSNGGRPYRFTASAAYELPFGADRAFLNDGGVLAAIVGGWQLAGNYDYQPGSLLGDWTNLFFYGNLEDIPLDNPTLDRWFNTDAGFEKDPASTPAGFQKRQFPFRVDGVRGQALSFLNMSLTRSLNVGSNRTVAAARRCAERAQPAALAERKHQSDQHEFRQSDHGDAELHAVRHVRSETELLTTASAQGAASI